MTAPCLQTSQTSPLKAAKLPFLRSALPAPPEALTTAAASQPAIQFLEGLLLDAILEPYTWSQSAQRKHVSVGKIELSAQPVLPAHLVLAEL